MIKNRKNKNHIVKNLLLLSSIALINITGVSYAGWTNESKIFTTIETAQMGPAFNHTNGNLESLDLKNDNACLSVKLEDERTLNIEGTVYTNYNGTVPYSIFNNGTIPVKFRDSFKSGSFNGLKIKLNQPAGVIFPEDSVNSGIGNPSLKIQAEQPGTYKFEIDLIFDQWTK